MSDDEKSAHTNGLPSLKMHEIIAGDPVAATRFFYTFIRLIIRYLFGCSFSPKDLSADGVAGAEPEGCFGVTSCWAAVVEPQMRKSLHLHGLTNLIGFRTPERLRQKFENGFDETVKKLWLWVASIHFESIEAFADACDVESATAELQKAPLIPITRKQKLLVGKDRARTSMLAQLHARGLSATDLPDAADDSQKRRRYKHIPWQPSFYGQGENLSAADWASAAVRDMSTASLTFLSHECRPETCHKGKVGIVGFCRLLFWRWRYVTKDKGAEWKRVHGKQLVPKPDLFTGVPINAMPPNEGKALAQQHHPFFIKCNPCTYMVEGVTMMWVR